MNPDANLDEQLRISKAVQAIIDKAGARPHGMFTDEERLALAAHAVHLGELIEALDHWITGGGVPPARWTERDMESQVARFAESLKPTNGGSHE